MTSKADRLAQVYQSAKAMREEQMAPINEHLKFAREAIERLAFDVQADNFPALSFHACEDPGFVGVNTQGHGFRVPSKRLLEAAAWIIDTFAEPLEYP